MTQPEPTRLIGFFAHGAPVCVIARRGPSDLTRFILWHTDKDAFTPGQWFRGKVDHATLSWDGRYMALGIMGTRSRGADGYHQVAVVCKPPYVSGIESWVGGLCMNSLAFLPGDILTVPEYAQKKSLTQSRCPFKRIPDFQNCPRDHDWVIDASRGPAIGADQFGRKITFEAGCIYVDAECGRTLLLDTNPMRFEPIKAPESACHW